MVQLYNTNGLMFFCISYSWNYLVLDIGGEKEIKDSETLNWYWLRHLLFHLLYVCKLLY